MTIRDSLTPTNFTKSDKRKILGIVLHSMWGTQIGSIAWFKNPSAQASAHFCVGQDGDIVRCVQEKDIAWHAGFYDEPIADWLKPNPNNTTIGIEIEDRRDPHWPYPDPQRKALQELVDYLCQTYSIPQDSEHILLHKNLNPTRRSDPVGAFDINWVLKVPQQDDKLPADTQRALLLIEAYKEAEKHGNLEGATNALLGAYRELQTTKKALADTGIELSGAKTQIEALKDGRMKVATKLGCSDDYDAILAEVQKLIEKEDQSDAGDHWEGFLKALLSLFKKK
jgi:N-acetyl-anhydromuramyl-L-alanine amidase AmpD